MKERIFPAAPAMREGRAAAPEGWDEALWKKLPPEARDKVRAMQEAQEAALMQCQRARLKDAMAFSRTLDEAGGLARRMAVFAEEVMKGDFHGIDWNALKSRDPDRAMALRRHFSRRAQTLEAMLGDMRRTAAEGERRRRVAEEARMRDELAAARPELEALLQASGEPCGRDCIGMLCAYLQDFGVPKEAVEAMSHGYEFRLALRAMLYDRMKDGLARAAERLSAAPDIHRPRRAHAADSGSRAALRDSLTSNPNSTEALAALFAAM